MTEQPAGDESSGLRGLGTICTMCAGMGKLSVPRLAIIGGVPRTVGELQTCQHCGGEGRRPDFEPPV